MQETITPQLQLDSEIYPELLNPDWVFWRASQMAPMQHPGTVQKPIEINSQLYLTAAREGGLLLAKKLLGDEFTEKEKNTVLWELRSRPEVAGLFAVVIIHLGEEPPVLDLNDPRRISDRYVKWAENQLRMLKVTTQSSLDLSREEDKARFDMAVKARCYKEYYKDVFGLVDGETSTDNLEMVKSLFEWSQDENDWQLQHIIDKQNGNVVLPVRPSHSGLRYVVQKVYSPEPVLFDVNTGRLNKLWIDWFTQHTGDDIVAALEHAAPQLEAIILSASTIHRAHALKVEQLKNYQDLKKYLEETFLPEHT